MSTRSESVDIPILGSVPAGPPLEAIAEARGSIAVPGRVRGEIFALQVKGDSMIEAGILDGDLVIVRKQDDAEDGDIVVALLDGEATVKYLERVASRVRLLPANPRYAPIELGEGSRIAGKVVGVQRYY